jgi:hypothetical protein
MRRRSGLLLVAFVVLLGACKVDAVVTIKVDDDGSGTVSARLQLDAEAVRAVETPTVKLKDAVRLGDLEAAGWEVSRWHRRENGGASVVVSKDFERAEDAADVVAELNGSVGPLRDIEVERDVSTFRTQWSFSGVADLEELTTGIGADPELVERLAAQRLDVAALDQELLAKVKDGFRLRVVADLPDSAAHRFTIAPGTVREMEESSSQRATGRMVLFATALLVLVVAGLVFLFGEVRDWRRRRALATVGGPSGRRIALFDQDDDEDEDAEVEDEDAEVEVEGADNPRPP